MPNGNPGDDWYTDIVGHGLATFSADADQLVRDIAAATGEGRSAPLDVLVNRHLDNVGYEELASRRTTVGMEYRNLKPAELEQLERDLRLLRATVERP